MFVISVWDNGNERNFVAIGVRMESGMAFIDCGGHVISYPIASVINIVPVDEVQSDDCTTTGERGALLN